MPSTEHFGIFYPDQRDVIDPAVFQDWVEDVEAALALITQVEGKIGDRPHGAWSFVGGGGVSMPSAGTYYPMNWARGASIGGFTWTPGSADVFVPTPGLYWVAVQMGQIGNVYPMTAHEIIVTRSGSRIFGQKMLYPSANGLPVQANFAGPLLITSTGQGINVQGRWYGTVSGGTPYMNYGYMGLVRLSEL